MRVTLEMMRLMSVGAVNAAVTDCATAEERCAVTT